MPLPCMHRPCAPPPPCLCPRWLGDEVIGSALAHPPPCPPSLPARPWPAVAERRGDQPLHIAAAGARRGAARAGRHARSRRHLPEPAPGRGRQCWRSSGGRPLLHPRSCLPTTPAGRPAGAQGLGPACHFFSTFFANKLYKDTGYDYSLVSWRQEGAPSVWEVGRQLPAGPWGCSHGGHAVRQATLAGPALAAAKPACPPAMPRRRCGAGRCPSASSPRARRASACWTATASWCRCVAWREPKCGPERGVSRAGREMLGECVASGRGPCCPSACLLACRPASPARRRRRAPAAPQVHQGVHWVCAVIDLKAQQLLYYDSLRVRPWVGAEPPGLGTPGGQAGGLPAGRHPRCCSQASRRRGPSSTPCNHAACFLLARAATGRGPALPGGAGALAAGRVPGHAQGGGGWGGAGVPRWGLQAAGCSGVTAGVWVACCGGAGPCSPSSMVRAQGSWQPGGPAGRTAHLPVHKHPPTCPPPPAHTRPPVHTHPPAAPRRAGLAAPVPQGRAAPAQRLRLRRLHAALRQLRGARRGLGLRPGARGRTGWLGAGPCPAGRPRGLAGCCPALCGLPPGRTPPSCAAPARAPPSRTARINNPTLQDHIDDFRVRIVHELLALRVD